MTDLVDYAPPVPSLADGVPYRPRMRVEHEAKGRGCVEWLRLPTKDKDVPVEAVVMWDSGEPAKPVPISELWEAESSDK
ncbi:hypothetical protein CLV30_10697 [Haloactinopolyspora alba]|uniref:Uncharacterized protein n=1 Tax=Haloactinopolyspora alba TaxID=648780 RepID=A0A2P8E3Q2_9ACTN|nr:hypothetical protein [Haloactinopolyspora alba]PSL04094.1 hypothetical protein CLV30_10697 [Haloactinopolyspora alba]